LLSQICPSSRSNAAKGYKKIFCNLFRFEGDFTGKTGKTKKGGLIMKRKAVIAAAPTPAGEKKAGT